MAYSKCPKCDNKSFEIQIQSPSGSNFKLAFVQCSHCGCVVGAMDYFNIGTKIIELEKKIDAISSTQSTTNSNLNTINNNIFSLSQLVASLKK